MAISLDTMAFPLLDFKWKHFFSSFFCTMTVRGRKESKIF